MVVIDAQNCAIWNSAGNSPVPAITSSMSNHKIVESANSGSVDSGSRWIEACCRFANVIDLYLNR